MDKSNSHSAADIARHYTPVETISLAANSTFPHPEPPAVIAHLTDPALNVMIDFEQTTPVTIYANTSIDNALSQMHSCGEHVLLVIDQDDAVLGLISSADIQGAKPLMLIQQRHIKRADVRVGMVMTPQQDVLTFDLDALRHAKVGNIVATLKLHKTHNALIVECDLDTQEQQVRGLFSLSRIGNMLGIDVTSLCPEAHSLAELQKIHS